MVYEIKFNIHLQNTLLRLEKTNELNLMIIIITLRYTGLLIKPY